MRIQERVTKEMKEAMKSGNTEMRDFLRIVKSDFDREGREITDEKATEILITLNKNAHIMKNEYEQQVLSTYLPEVMDNNAIKVKVTDIITKGGYAGMKDISKVMAESKEVPGMNMKEASIIAKSLLSS